MMPFENIEVSSKVDETDASFRKGMNDGIESYGKPLPNFLYEKSAAYLKPYEQGYWFGLMLETQGRKERDE
jgi:hypothetical protein